MSAQKLSSGGFSGRSSKTEKLVTAAESSIFTRDRYIRIPTGIEHQFKEKADKVHELLYRSMGPTTDLLRYFPDCLYLDRFRQLPTWAERQSEPVILEKPAGLKSAGLFSFYVEYKFSDSERKRPIADIPTPFIGIIEREAWLTYRRLTTPNPKLGLYLDEQRTRIALFYAAIYAPEKIYAGWEEWIEPIESPEAVRKNISRPNQKAVGFSTGSGTPWINFDIRRLKPLTKFLKEDLFWEAEEAEKAAHDCKMDLGVQ